MSTVLLQKSTRAIAWLIAASVAIAFAAPQALAFENLGTFRYQWISQSGTLSADGTAHEVAANPGDTVSMNMTIRNRSTNAAALTMYGTSALLDEGTAYPNAHAVGLGTSHPRDNVPAWIDSSSFAINGNRFTYYDGDAVNPGEDLTLTWTVKIASTAANGTYDLYTEIVREWDGWAQQVTAAGVPIGNGDIFWRFLIGGTVTGGGDLNIGIAGDTPGDANVAELNTDVPMTRISFTAGASDNALITSIAVRKTGLSADTDISDLKLYDGATKLGSTQGVNSTTHKATFTGLSWLIPAGTTKTLTIKATIPSAAAVGDILVVGIQSAADVVLSGSGTVTGNFPAYGNEFTVASISVGYLDVTAPSTPADNSGMISGSTDQDLASFKFAADSTEGFDINSITLTEIGTSVDSDVINMKLKYLGNQIGSTEASLSDGKVTFTGSPLFSVAAGTNKTIYVVGDIATGITSARTIRFEINDTPDVVAYGQSSNGIVTITTSGATTAYTVAQGSTMTIAQGSLSVTISSTNLSAQTYIIGEEQAEMSKFKFSAGANEGLKITKLIFNEDLDAVTTDYQNARLYIDDSETPIAVGGSISGTTVTFEDGNGLFEVARSGNTEVTLKIDVSTAASADATFRFGIGADDNAYTNIVMYGLTSNEKIDSDSTHITALTAVDDGDMVTHEINASGTFVVSNGPNTPAAANFALGTDDFEFVQFRMQAVSEAARVTAVTVRFFDDSAVAGDDYGANEVGTNDVTNAELYYWDGTAWIMLDEVSTPTNGVASFTFDHTIPKNTTQTFKVVADIPPGASLTYLFTGISGTGDETLDIWDDVSATGVSSGVTLNSGEMTGASDSSVFTKVAPILTVTASTVPVAHSIVINTTDELLGKFFLTANDVEDIKVSTLKISADENAGNMASTSTAAEDFANIYLRFDDGGTWRTTVPETMTAGDGSPPDQVIFSGSDFIDPNEWVVPKGGSIVVEIRGDLVATAASVMCFGQTATATDTVATGVNSGTAATIYDSGSNGIPDAYNAIWETPELTLADNGGVSIAAATDTPTTQMVTASYGTTTISPTFFRAKVTATNVEDLEIDAIRAKVADQGSAGEDENFAGPVYVYEGGTMSGNVLTGGTLVGQGNLFPVAGADAAVDIVFTTTVTVPKGSSKYLTLVADLGSIDAGAVSGEAPYLGIDYNCTSGIWDSNYANKISMRTTGAASGVKVYTAGGSAILKGSAAIVAKTVLGVELHSSSPSGTATRQANHTIFKLNFTNTSTDTDARFRAATNWDLATAGEGPFGDWTASDGTVTASATKAVDTVTGIQWTTDGTWSSDQYISVDASAINIVAFDKVSFWVMTTAPHAAAGDISMSLDDAAAVDTASDDQTIQVPIITEDDTWHRVDAQIGTAAVGGGTVDADTDYIGFVIDANHGTYDGGEIMYFDEINFYYDSIRIDLTSNDGLYDLDTSDASKTFYLKDAATGTTLATGYLNGTDTGSTKLQSIAMGDVLFIPETEMAIPASGKTYNVVVDTTALITNTSKDLTMSMALGSATSAGVITDGDILWNDNSLSTAQASNIGWVDSPDSPLARSLNF